MQLSVPKIGVISTVVLLLFGVVALAQDEGGHTMPVANSSAWHAVVVGPWK